MSEASEVSEDLKTEIENLKKELESGIPSNVTNTEQMIKFGAIIPLMLILGNHLGNFLPYTLTSEIRSSNRHRNSSLILIYALLVISFYGSIDYTLIPKAKNHPELFPLFDLISALVAMILLLMMLRFSHDWMYVVFLTLVLSTMGLFYSAKKKAEANPDAPSPKEIKIVKTLLWIGVGMIIVFYVMSWNFMNKHYTEFYNTDLVYTRSNNETWFAKTKEYFHMGEYMFTPRPMDNPEAFSRLTRMSRKNFTLDYFKPSYIPIPFTRLYNKDVANHVQELDRDCVKLTFSDATKQRNELFIANSDQIMSTRPAATPSQIWMNEIPKASQSSYRFRLAHLFDKDVKAALSCPKKSVISPENVKIEMPLLESFN